jgi:hypothetical protein
LRATMKSRALEFRLHWAGYWGCTRSSPCGEKPWAGGKVDALWLNVLSWRATHESVLKQLIEISPQRPSLRFVVADVLRSE